MMPGLLKTFPPGNPATAGSLIFWLGLLLAAFNTAGAATASSLDPSASTPSNRLEHQVITEEHSPVESSEFNTPSELAVTAATSEAEAIEPQSDESAIAAAPVEPDSVEPDSASSQGILPEAIADNSVVQPAPTHAVSSSTGGAANSSTFPTSDPSAPFAFRAPQSPVATIPVLPATGAVPVAPAPATSSYAQTPAYNPSAPFAFQTPMQMVAPAVSPVPFNPGAAYPGFNPTAVPTAPSSNAAIVQSAYAEPSAAIPLQVPYPPSSNQQTSLPAPPPLATPVAQLPTYPYSPGMQPAPGYAPNSYPATVQTTPIPSYPTQAPAAGYGYPYPTSQAPAPGYGYPYPTTQAPAASYGYPYPTGQVPAPGYGYPGYPSYGTSQAPAPSYGYPYGAPAQTAPTPPPTSIVPYPAIIQSAPAPGVAYPGQPAPAPGYGYPYGTPNPAAPAPLYPPNSPYPTTSQAAPAPQPIAPPAQTPLLRSSALTAPSLRLQGVYVLQDSESSARARLTAVYPLTPRLLFGGTLDLTEGNAFSDSRTEGLSVNELYLATSIADLPNLRFVLGQLDLTSYFDRNSFAKDGASQFFNSVFQTNPALTAASVGSRPGVLVNWSLNDNIEARATAFSSSRNLNDFALDGFAGEIGLRFGNAIIRGTYVSARDAGGGDGFQEIFGIDRGNGITGVQEDDREEGYGVNAEVFIPELNMGIFGRYGHYENRDLEEGGDTFSGGISFLDVFSRDDRLGLAYGRALSNDNLRGEERTPDVLELFYDFRLLPNLRLGFTFQQQNEFSESVAGFRIRTDFDITPRGL